MVHRFEPATPRVDGGEPATLHGYYVTPGNVAVVHRGAPGVNVGGENRGVRESRKVGGRRGAGGAAARGGSIIYGRENARAHTHVHRRAESPPLRVAAASHEALQAPLVRIPWHTQAYTRLTFEKTTL